MLVGCGSGSVTSSSIRLSDAAVPPAAVVDWLSTNHRVRPQFGLVPEQRHQLPGKPLLIFEQRDQQVRQLRSCSAPQLTPSLSETPSLPLCSLTHLLPCKKKAFLHMRRRSGGLISDRLSRAWECAKAKRKEKGAQSRNRDSGTVMENGECAGATFASQWVMLRALQITTGVLGKHCGEAACVRHRLEQLRAFGAQTLRGVQSITHGGVSCSSWVWQKRLSLVRIVKLNVTNAAPRV